MSNSFNVTNYEELKLLDREKRIIVLNEELKDKNTKELGEEWNCKPSKINDMKRLVGLPSSLGAVRMSKTEKKKPKKENNKQNSKEEIKKIEQIKPLQMTMAAPLEPESVFTIKMGGKMQGEEIIDRIIRMAEIITKDKKYHITFEIKELKTEADN